MRQSPADNKQNLDVGMRPETQTSWWSGASFARMGSAGLLEPALVRKKKKKQTDRMFRAAVPSSRRHRLHPVLFEGVSIADLAVLPPADGCASATKREEEPSP